MSYPTKEKPQMSETSSLDQIFWLFCSNFLFSICFFQRLEKFHLSFFDEKLFCICAAQSELASRAIGVLLLGNVFKMGEKYFYSGRWHSWKISLMSPFPLLPKIQPNWLKPPEFVWMCSKLLKSSIFSISITFSTMVLFTGGEVLCIPLAAKQKGPTDFINTLREWVGDKTHLEA